MKQETRPVYVTDDGKVFDAEADALDHEAKIRERQKALVGLKVWRVRHGFDATEGRGYFATTLIASDASSAVLTQWCLNKFGMPLDRWYGDGFYEAWYLRPPSETDTVEWAIEHDGYKPGHYERPWELVVVSKQDFTWAGLPKSEFPWPDPKKEAAD